MVQLFLFGFISIMCYFMFHIMKDRYFKYLILMVVGVSIFGSGIMWCVDIGNKIEKKTEAFDKRVDSIQKSVDKIGEGLEEAGKTKGKIDKTIKKANDLDKGVRDKILDYRDKIFGKSKRLEDK